MKPRLSALAVAVLLVAALASSCGSDTGVTANDPGSPDPSTVTGMPTEIPAADGKVRTLNLITVMDTGTPEVCLGPVAESYPPQCSGPELVGWDWNDHEGMFDQQGDIRWGTFVLTGTFDGTSMTVSEAIPGALYDPAMPTPVPTPTPGTSYSEAELAKISEEAGHLPGAQGAYAGDGHVLVDVVYDDGSLQAWADEEYGENVVLVSSMLVDVEQ